MTGYFPFSIQNEFRRKLNTATTTEEHFLFRRSGKLASRSFLENLLRSSLEQQCWLSLRILEHEIFSRRAEMANIRSVFKKNEQQKNLNYCQSDLGNEQRGWKKWYESWWNEWKEIDYKSIFIDLNYWISHVKLSILMKIKFTDNCWCWKNLSLR